MFAANDALNQLRSAGGLRSRNCEIEIREKKGERNGARQVIGRGQAVGRGASRVRTSNFINECAVRASSSISSIRTEATADTASANALPGHSGMEKH